MAARRIALTGATRGLGRALVERFIEAGHTLHGCGRSADKIAELMREFGDPHSFRVVDVANDAAVAAWASEILRMGPPDLVINNAGLINASAPIWNVPADEFARVVAVNLNGTASVLRAFLPALNARGQGVIANVSSGWGRSTAPEVAPYCATKWAVEGLSQAVAQEVAAGVAVCAVNPGVIHTEMLESCFGAGARQFPDPNEWAGRAASFLLGLDAAANGRALSI